MVRAEDDVDCDAKRLVFGRLAGWLFSCLVVAKQKYRIQDEDGELKLDTCVIMHIRFTMAHVNYHFSCSESLCTLWFCYGDG